MGEGSQTKTRRAERGFDRQTAEQLDACAKVRVEGYSNQANSLQTSE